MTATGCTSRPRIWLAQHSDDPPLSPPRVAAGLNQATKRMEQKRAGAAGWVQNTLCERRVHGLRDHASGKPIGCIVFAQVMTLVRVNQTFVKHLEHVGLDVGEAEPGGFGSNLPHQIGAGGTFQWPIKEVGFDRAENALVGERSARKQSLRIRHRKIEHTVGNSLDHDGQVGVLEEKRILADLLAVGFA